MESPYHLIIDGKPYKENGREVRAKNGTRNYHRLSYLAFVAKEENRNVEFSKVTGKQFFNVVVDGEPVLHRDKTPVRVSSVSKAYKQYVAKNAEFTPIAAISQSRNENGEKREKFHVREQGKESFAKTAKKNLVVVTHGSRKWREYEKAGAVFESVGRKTGEAKLVGNAFKNEQFSEKVVGPTMFPADVQFIHRASDQSVLSAPTPFKTVRNMGELKREYAAAKTRFGNNYAVIDDFVSTHVELPSGLHTVKYLGHNSLENCVVHCIRMCCGSGRAARIYSSSREETRSLVAETAMKTDSNLESLMAGEFPVCELESPVILDSEGVGAICKAADVRLRVFTRLANVLGSDAVPWAEFGPVHGKVVSVICDDGNVVLRDYAANLRVVIDPDIQVAPSNAVIQYVSNPSANNQRIVRPYDLPKASDAEAVCIGYVVSDRDGYILHKKYDPFANCVVPHVLAEKKAGNIEELQLEYAGVMCEQVMFQKCFSKHFGITPTRQFCDLVKQAEIFIGRARVSDLEIDLEYDKNRAYCSTSYSKYYQGFPSADMYAAAFDSTNPQVAFVIVESCDFSGMGAREREIVCSLFALCSMRCLPAVMFSRFVELGVIFVVEYALYAVFKKMDVIEFAHEYFPGCKSLDAAIPEKLLTNSLIGSMIRGGIDERNIVRFPSVSAHEAGQICSECTNLSFPFVCAPRLRENRDGNVGAMQYDLTNCATPAGLSGVKDVTGRTLWVIGGNDETEIGRPCVVPDDFDVSVDVVYDFRIDISGAGRYTKGAFHWHSWILAYANLAVLDAWIELGESIKVVGFNTDALYLNTANASEEDVKKLWGSVGFELNQWKIVACGEKELSRRPELVASSHTSDNVKMPLPLPVGNGSRVFVNGPAGVGKSYHFYSIPSDQMIFGCPTKALRDEHIRNLETIEGGNLVECVTVHKYLQLDMTDVEYFEWARNAMPSKLRNRSILVVDESTQFNTLQWARIINRHRGFVVALGDWCQIANGITGAAVTPEFFVANGFNMVEFSRREEVLCRHTYSYGCALDAMRGLEFREQVAIARRLFRIVCGRELVDEIAGNANSMVVCSRHARARGFNLLARRLHSQICVENKRTKTKKGEVVSFEVMDVGNEGIWWDRVRMTQSIPRGYTYEPRFARTCYSLQGSQSREMTYFVDYETLEEPGAFYTAVTRAVSGEQVVLIEVSDSELDLLKNL